MDSNETVVMLAKPRKKGLLRLVFSRFFVIVLLIILQLLVFASVYLWLQQYMPHYLTFQIVFTILMILYLFNSGMDSSAKLTWLMLIAVFPFVGAAFLLFTQMNFGHRAIRKREAELIDQTKDLIPQDEGVRMALSGDIYGTDDLQTYLSRSGCFPVFGNTEVRYFPLGEEKFAAMLEELEKAEEFIFFEYFIIEEGYMWGRVLKVLEDKRAFFESTYYDPTDPKVPPYIKKLFDEGAPADFVLIGATTREARDISPALRSRCAEIYFEPLTPAHIVRIVENAAKKLDAALADGVADLISDYTVEGRKAINILADAYSFALERRESGAPVVIGKDDVYEVAQVSRLYQYVKDRSSEHAEIGHIFGLGVSGYLGSVIEIEAVAFPAHEKGKGAVRFNETAGSMAKDSVFNAASVVRRMTGLELSDFDLHINVVGGGNIDGPSAGTAILAAITSALTHRPLRQDVAVTGEISLYGQVRPVGGVFEKAYGAKQAGMKSIIIPAENKKDIPDAHLGLSVHPVETADEAFRLLFADGWDKKQEGTDENGDG